jgi:hypothetical protein
MSRPLFNMNIHNYYLDDLPLAWSLCCCQTSSMVCWRAGWVLPRWKIDMPTVFHALRICSGQAC